MSGTLRRLRPLGSAADGDGGLDCAGAKAARLATALRAGFPVLPGWVVPVAEGRPALAAGAAEVAGGRPAAARRAVLAHPVDPELASELREAVRRLGGRVIVRSSSPLEADPRWSGAFSSVAEVGPADAEAAVRSCWASAFAVDPLERLESCGLPLSALEVGMVIQPEIVPTAGGVARVARDEGAAPAAAGLPDIPEVVVEGVPGHPGALLSGWAEGASGQALAGLLGAAGADVLASVAHLAATVRRAMGDDVIEWAAVGAQVYLLQTLRSARAVARPGEPRRPAAPAQRLTSVFTSASGPAADGPRADADSVGATSELVASRERMPLLAAIVQAHGEHLTGCPAAPGTAAGRLAPVRPHERPGGTCRDAILLVDRPVPALAPLLFGARGVIARAGAAGAHLAEVARSLGVPMVVGCRAEELLTGPPPPASGWLAAVDGDTGDVALLPGSTAPN